MNTLLNHTHVTPLLSGKFSFVSFQPNNKIKRKYKTENWFSFSLPFFTDDITPSSSLTTTFFVNSDDKTTTNFASSSSSRLRPTLLPHTSDHINHAIDDLPSSSSFRFVQIWLPLSYSLLSPSPSLFFSKSMSLLFEICIKGCCWLYFWEE